MELLPAYHVCKSPDPLEITYGRGGGGGGDTTQ